MKALPLMFKVSSISEHSIESRCVNCIILSSCVDSGAGKARRSYQIVLNKNISDKLGEGDIFKIIIYADKKPTKIEDYNDFEPLGRRIEVMRKGEDVWNLIEMEMK